MSFLSDIVNRAQNQLQKNKSVINNIKYLGILQVFNLIIPFISYPYLIKVLGVSLYGKIVLAQMVISYFSLFIDYGFRMSATKQIAAGENSRDEIVSSVLILKFFLWIISFLVLLVFISFIGFFQNDKYLFLLTFLICFNEFLFPTWFFQGIEKMKYITYLNLSVKILFVVLIFIFVKKESDYLMVPLTQGLGAFIGALVGVWIMLSRYGIKLIIPSIQRLKYYLLDSSSLFVSYFVISIKDRFNLFFIGLSLPISDVAVYDLSMKLINMLMQPIEVIVSAVYPKVSREKSIHMVFFYAKITFFLMVVLCFVSFFVFPYIIEFLGKGQLDSSILLSRVLLIAPLILSWGLHFGRNGLLAFGRNRVYLKGMILSTLFYLLIVGLVYFIGFNKYLFSFAIITILVYAFELGYRFMLIKKK